MEFKKHYIIRIADRFRLTAFTLALVLFSVAATLGMVPIVALSYWADIPAQSLVVATITMLINCASVAYLCGMSLFGIHRLQRFLTALKPHYAHDPAAFEQLCTAPALDRHPKFLWRITLAGFLFGLVMLTVGRIYENLYRDGLPAGYEVWPFIVIPVLWTAIAYASAIFASNARFAGRVARELPHVDLLNNDSMTVFTRISTVQVLFVLGAITVLPLQSFLLGNIEMDDVLPAGIVAILMIIYCMVHPLSDARARIREEKSKELEKIETRLRAIPTDERLTHDDVPKLLAYREAIENVDDWPLSGSALIRLGLYVFIPPVTWALAAVISFYVEAAFDAF